MEPLTSPAGAMFGMTGDKEPSRERPAPTIAADDRGTCRWCLLKFDVEAQVRSIPERAYLRQRLLMADDGSELVCCDECWQGAIGALNVIHGRIVPADPNRIDNPLLRASVA